MRRGELRTRHDIHVGGAGRVYHADKELRLEVIREFVADNPWIAEDTEESLEAVYVLIDALGPMTHSEIAEVFGVTRQRIQQNELVALRKLKLQWQQRLRPYLEDTAPLVTVWDQLELTGGG